MGRVGLLPRQVDDARYLLTVAEKDGVATAHLPVLAAGRAARDRRPPRLLRPRPQRTARCQARVGPPAPTRARVCENEAGHVRARLDRRGHVLLARQAAHLHERTREELARASRAGSAARMSVGADEDRVRSRQLGGGTLGARLDPALGDHDPISRRRRDEPELRVAVDAKRGEIARVDPDHRSTERHRPRRAPPRRAPRRASPDRVARRVSSSARSWRVVEIAEEQQRCVGARFAGGPQVAPHVEKNPFARSGSAADARAARRSSHVPPKRSSTRIETAAAPARSYAAASTAGSASGAGRPPTASGA